MLIIRPSESGKTHVLLDLIQKQDNEDLVDKIYLYANYLSEPKYQFLIKKREDAGTKNLDDPSAFIEYSKAMDDVYNNTDDYNPKSKREILIAFDYTIADIMTNKKFQTMVKELFIRCRKWKISLVFITQSYFSVPKEVTLSSTHCLIMNTHNRRELKNIAFDYSADIYEPYSFLATDTTLPVDNTIRFRKNFSDSPL